MGIKTGHHVAWRWQGLQSCCWLTSIEMLMQCKYGNIYGKDQIKHSDFALQEYRENKGSNIYWHDKSYNLAENKNLQDCKDAGVWQNALRRGPVLASGLYGWSRVGMGLHVILIAGISHSNKLAFYNPNFFACLPHPGSKLSYFSIDRCIELSRGDGFSPFWQVREDMDLPPRWEGR